MKLVTANCGSQFLFLVRSCLPYRQVREMGIMMSHFLSHNTRRSVTLNRNNLCHNEPVEVRHKTETTFVTLSLSKCDIEQKQSLSH